MIDSGTMDPINNSQLLLKKDEIVYFEHEAILKTIQNKLLGSTGNSGAVSVRLTKGIYLRSGNSGSRKVYGDVTMQYNGLLSITNKRIVFLNSQKGFEISLSKLTNIFSDGNNIILQCGNTTRIIEISNADILEHLIRKLFSN